MSQAWLSLPIRRFCICRSNALKTKNPRNRWMSTLNESEIASNIVARKTLSTLSSSRKLKEQFWLQFLRDGEQSTRTKSSSEISIAYLQFSNNRENTVNQAGRSNTCLNNIYFVRNDEKHLLDSKFFLFVCLFEWVDTLNKGWIVLSAKLSSWLLKRLYWSRIDTERTAHI